MRHTLASLVLALVSFPLIAPMLLANAASNLPACCRRNGQHHCAMADGDAGAGLRANQPKCPFFPKAGAVPAITKIILLGTAPRASAPYFSGVAIATPDRQLVCIAWRDCLRQRGPPTYH
jgi:hypothetical protein